MQLIEDLERKLRHLSEPPDPYLPQKLFPDKFVVVGTDKKEDATYDPEKHEVPLKGWDRIKKRVSNLLDPFKE